MFSFPFNLLPDLFFAKKRFRPNLEKKSKYLRFSVWVPHKFWLFSPYSIDCAENWILTLRCWLNSWPNLRLAVPINEVVPISKVYILFIGNSIFSSQPGVATFSAGWSLCSFIFSDKENFHWLPLPSICISSWILRTEEHTCKGKDPASSSSQKRRSKTSKYYNTLLKALLSWFLSYKRVWVGKALLIKWKLLGVFIGHFHSKSCNVFSFHVPYFLKKK